MSFGEFFWQQPKSRRFNLDTSKELNLSEISKQLNVSETQLASIFLKYDVNKNGKLESQTPAGDEVENFLSDINVAFTKKNLDNTSTVQYKDIQGNYVTELYNQEGKLIERNFKDNAFNIVTLYPNVKTFTQTEPDGTKNLVTCTKIIENGEEYYKLNKLNQKRGTFETIFVRNIDENGNYSDADIIEKQISSNSFRRTINYSDGQINGYIQTADGQESQTTFSYPEEGIVVRVTTTDNSISRAIGNDIQDNGNLTNIKEICQRNANGTGLITQMTPKGRIQITVSKMNEDFSYNEQDITKREFIPNNLELNTDNESLQELSKILTTMFEIKHGKDVKLEYDENLIKQLFENIQENATLIDESDTHATYRLSLKDSSNIEYSLEVTVPKGEALAMISNTVGLRAYQGEARYQIRVNGGNTKSIYNFNENAKKLS